MCKLHSDLGRAAIVMPTKSLRKVGVLYIHKQDSRFCRWNGKAICCEHGKSRSRCVLCEGSGICKHKRQRNICRDCAGSSMCKHGRRKNTCRDCQGTSVCEHGRQRCRCKQCGGSCLCSHGKQRSHCGQCGPRCVSQSHILDEHTRPYGAHKAPTDGHEAGNRATDTSVHKGDRLCSACMRALFPSSHKLVLRMEHVVLAQLQNLDGPSGEFYHCTSWDCRLPCGTRVPDMLWVWIRNTTNGERRLLGSTSNELASISVRDEPTEQHVPAGWEIVAFQIVEVDEGGVANHDTAKRRSGCDHETWTQQVANAIGVGGQVIRVGVAADNIPYHIYSLKQPPTEDVVFTRTKTSEHTLYHVPERHYFKFETKMLRVLGHLSQFAASIDAVCTQVQTHNL